jgi:hypothetical protein
MIDRLTQRQQLRRSAERALQTNMHLLTGGLAHRAATAGVNDNSVNDNSEARWWIAPLDPKHLEDLWPADLPGETPDSHAAARRLNDEFRYIANLAGRKIDDLARTNPPERRMVEQHAEIIEEARTFATVAVESAVRTLGNGRPPAPPLPEPDPPPQPDPQPHPDPQPQPPVAQRRHEPAITAPMPAIHIPREQAVHSQLDELLAFIARQEPRVAWALGVRPDGATVLATDVAHGWIPPRIALPIGIELIQPGTSSGSAAALLGEVHTSLHYTPGGAFPAAGDDDAAIMSAISPRRLPDVGDIMTEMAHHSARRPGVAPAVKSLTRSVAAGNQVLEKGMHTIYAHVDVARHQLLSDYPLVDRTLLCDCMLLAAIEAWVTGDLTSANYHFAWFTALNDES